MNRVLHDSTVRAGVEMARQRVFARFHRSLFEGNLVPPWVRIALAALGALLAGGVVALTLPMRLPDAVVPSNDEIRVLEELHRSRAGTQTVGLKSSGRRTVDRP